MKSAISLVMDTMKGEKMRDGIYGGYMMSAAIDGFSLQGIIRPDWTGTIHPDGIMTPSGFLDLADLNSGAIYVGRLNPGHMWHGERLIVWTGWYPL